MANHMAEVAKMLGVELDEEFYVYGYKHGVFTAKITLDGCWISCGKKGFEHYNQSITLRNLLNGKYYIKRIACDIDNKKDKSCTECEHNKLEDYDEYCLSCITNDRKNWVKKNESN